MQNNELTPCHWTCRGKAAVGVSMWMRVLLPQVLGTESGAFPSDDLDVAGGAISRLSNSGAAAALDMLDIAMAPGGARHVLCSARSWALLLAVQPTKRFLEALYPVLIVQFTSTTSLDADFAHSAG